MKNAQKLLNGNNSAVIVDGKLILSLPDALSPVVWQMDLDQTKSSALEVKENSDSCSLLLKSEKNEIVEIARFANKPMTIQALMAASRALEKGHGQIRNISAGTNPAAFYGAPPKPRRTWLGVLLGMLLLFVLLNVWGMAKTKNLNTAASTQNEAAAGTTSNGRDGVPLSADEYLRRD